MTTKRHIELLDEERKIMACFVRNASDPVLYSIYRKEWMRISDEFYAAYLAVFNEYHPDLR